PLRQQQPAHERGVQREHGPEGVQPGRDQRVPRGLVQRRARPGPGRASGQREDGEWHHDHELFRRPPEREPQLRPQPGHWHDRDPAPAGLASEGYGAEVRWNLNDLYASGVLVAGHNYRFYVMVHDGDQNKSGGDSGQAAYNYVYSGPVSKGASLSGSVYVDAN